MIEKVNPSHPDKVADRIAGALVDYAYTLQETPKVAFEVLIGHGLVTIIAETSVELYTAAVESIVQRIAPGDIQVNYLEVPQDPELAENQSESVKAGDNGIFKGVPMNDEVKRLSEIARNIYAVQPTDGKYILAGNRLIVCQSNATHEQLEDLLLPTGHTLVINPLGEWTGGTDVDTGAVNRKLGSDMGEAVTGGGLHGKDLSKADVSVNIYAHLKAQAEGEVVNIACAIGDDTVDGLPYEEIVARAGEYIKEIGGFEKLAEWGLV
ncbi:MAG TPA: S-adenosylmethionine synthetase N-terminal domain-containing protein [Candidatus Saccharibacteria bacterium]|nr:S-adenosylmethionine synthetase N-terminal domain-containing protein [Candidatus Saccharibacteria bacterium]